MKIERIEKLAHERKVLPGDKFALLIDGEIAHSVDIERVGTISHWALVRAGNSLGYFIGDENLEKDLNEKHS